MSALVPGKGYPGMGYGRYDSMGEDKKGGRK